MKCPHLSLQHSFLVCVLCAPFPKRSLCVMVLAGARGSKRPRAVSLCPSLFSPRSPPLRVRSSLLSPPRSLPLACVLCGCPSAGGGAPSAARRVCHRRDAAAGGGVVGCVSSCARVVSFPVAWCIPLRSSASLRPSDAHPTGESRPTVTALTHCTLDATRRQNTPHTTKQTQDESRNDTRRGGTDTRRGVGGARLVRRRVHPSCGRHAVTVARRLAPASAPLLCGARWDSDVHAALVSLLLQESAEQPDTSRSLSPLPALPPPLPSPAVRLAPPAMSVSLRRPRAACTRLSLLPCCALLATLPLPFVHAAADVSDYVNVSYKPEYIIVSKHTHAQNTTDGAHEPTTRPALTPLLRAVAPSLCAQASYLIACLGSATSLQVMKQRTGLRGLRNWLLLLGGSVALGLVAIW